MINQSNILSVRVKWYHQWTTSLADYGEKTKKQKLQYQNAVAGNRTQYKSACLACMTWVWSPTTTQAHVHMHACMYTHMNKKPSEIKVTVIIKKFKVFYK